ncbi:hypothetical protein FOZ63_023948 [Perkinsus olseni]|uniref:Uncharacterized protein n=1 Tax=Perkinsus olseni TaxID=32597 RepID=A0A7J6U3L3_PEROL|nr:hypothetical protein FOZ63_023948 [Perkinsus olseni]
MTIEVWVEEMETREKEYLSHCPQSALLSLSRIREFISTIANSTSSPTLLPSGDPSETRYAEVTAASAVVMGVAVILSAGCIYAVLRMGRAGREESAPTAGTSDGAMLVASCASCGREQYVPRIETAVAFTCFECRRANPVPWVAPHPVEQAGPLMEYEFTRVNNTFFRVSGQREHNASKNSAIMTPLAPIMVGRPAEEEEVDVPSCTICMVDYREGGEKWKISEEFSEVRAYLFSEALCLPRTYRFSSLLMTTAAADADPHSSAASSSTKRSVSSMATAPDVAPLTKLYDLQKRRQRAR